MLISTKPYRVGRAYKKALADAQDFERDSARYQLLLYQRLGILTENTQAALETFPLMREHQTHKSLRRGSSCLIMEARYATK